MADVSFTEPSDDGASVDHGTPQWGMKTHFTAYLCCYNGAGWTREQIQKHIGPDWVYDNEATHGGIEVVFYRREVRTPEEPGE